MFQVIRARMISAVILALLAGSALAWAQPTPQREITPIKGDLYRFRNARHFSIFLATPDGIIATDPIDAQAARWLKAEMARRFAKPVRYLIYSHDHADHISGGEIFTDSAVVIAHDAAKAAILRHRRPTAVPDVSFTDRLTVELGGKKVELFFLGKNHSDNSIVLRFPDERVLFAVDFISVRSLPYRNFPDGYIDEWIDSLKKAEALDFDILAPGHGALGRKEDVRALRIYMEDLRNQVGQHLGEGKSMDEIKQLVTMEKYSSWRNYKRYLPLNIEGMARQIQMRQN